MWSRSRWLALFSVLVSVTVVGPLFAAPQLYWDPTATNTSAGGGTGTWNTASWWNTTTDVAWSNGSDANFGGVAGTVTLSASLSAADLNFTTAGYTVTGTSLALTGGTVTMGVTSGTIASVIMGTAGLRVNGGGNLWTSGSNTVSGGVFVNSGSLTINGGGNSSAGAYPSSIITVANGGELDLNQNDSTGFGNGNWLVVSGVLRKTNNQAETFFRPTLLSNGTMTSTGTFTGGTIGGQPGQAYETFGNYIQTFPGTSNYIMGSGAFGLRTNGGYSSVMDTLGNSTLTISVPVDQNSNSSGTPFNKAGPGGLTLTSTSLYTGNTNIAAGTLFLTGTAAIPVTPQILIWPGAALDVSGLNSTFTLAATQTLAGGRTTTPGTDINGNVTSGGTIAAAGALTINGNLGLTGGAIVAGLSSAASTNLTTPALTLTNTTTIAPSFISNGTFTVLNSTAAIAGAGTLTLGNPIQGLASYRGSGSGSLSIGANSVSVTYSGLTPGSQTWTGASSVWNVNGAANWNGSGSTFFNGDAVTFINTTVSSSISIASGVNVYPSSMTFSNTAGTTFVLTGTGTIAGPAALTVNGGGVLQFAGTNTANNLNTNSFWGGTTITNGTIELGNNVQTAAQSATNNTSENANSLGTGPVAINGGQLRFYPGGTQYNYFFPNAITLNGGNVFQSDGHQYLEGPITVAASGGTLFAQFGNAYNSFGPGAKTLIVDGAISGSGPIMFGYGGSGTGNFFVNAANTGYTGTATIAATTVVYLASPSAFLNAYMSSLGGTIGFESTSSTFATVDGSVACPLTTTGNSPTPGAPVALSVGALSNTGYSGLMSGAGSLVVKGGGTFYMISATNTYAGGTTVNGSVLNLGNVANENANSMGSGSVSIVNNGTLHMAPGSTGNTYAIPNAITLNGGTIWQEDGNQVLQGALTIGAGGGTLNGAWGNGWNNFTGAKTLTDSGGISGSGPLAFGWGGPGGTANIFLNSANSYSARLRSTIIRSSIWATRGLWPTPLSPSTAAAHSALPRLLPPR